MQRNCTYIALLLLLLSNVMVATAQTQPRALNMRLLGQWSSDSIPITSVYQARYSGCWGLTVNKRDIAVVGASNAILFFDVTEDGPPKLLAKFPSAFTTLWREFRSYKNRVYAVSGGSVTEGLRIFDLSALPAGTIRESKQTNAFFQSAHTITIDTLHGRLYLNGSNTARTGLLVLSVADSLDSPKLLATTTLQSGYVHDSYVRNHIVYASSAYSGLYVYDFTNPQTPRILASVNTGGYNHNSWLSQDGRYAFYTEEIPPKRPIRVLDIQKVNEGEMKPVKSVLDSLTPGAITPESGPIPHNVIIRDNLLYNSQYEDGLLVYNISNPANPVLVAHYDTHPQNVRYNGYYGNWGCYPYGNGKILAADMQNGVFLLRQTATTIPTTESTPEKWSVKVWPNPAVQSVALQIDGPLAKESAAWRVQLFNQWGQMVSTEAVPNGANTIVLPVQTLPRGMYYVKVLDEGKIIKAVEKIILR